MRLSTEGKHGVSSDMLELSPWEFAYNLYFPSIPAGLPRSAIQAIMNSEAKEDLHERLHIRKLHL